MQTTVDVELVCAKCGHPLTLKVGKSGKYLVVPCNNGRCTSTMLRELETAKTEEISKQVNALVERWGEIPKACLEAIQKKG